MAESKDAIKQIRKATRRLFVLALVVPGSIDDSVSYMNAVSCDVQDFCNIFFGIFAVFPM